MKKQLKKFIVFCLFFAVTFNLKAQQKAWHLFKLSADYPNLQFTSSTSTFGTPFPQSYKSGSVAFGNYVGTNVMTDVSGKLIFSVITTTTGIFVYDINNTLIASLGNPSSGSRGNELAIVPLDKGGRFHIITRGNVWQYDMVTNKVSYSYNFVMGSQEANFAVRMTIQGSCINGYNLYYIDKNHEGPTSYYRSISRITVNNSGISLSQSVNIQSVTTGFTSFLGEFEISPDGSKLAFADDNKVFVYNVGTDGSIGSLNNSITYDATATNKVAGIEFTPDNSKLVFTTFSPSNVSGNDFVFLWDFTNSSSASTFTSSTAFGRSMIETGRDGKIYVGNTSGLYQLNTGALTISSVHTSEALVQNSFGVFNLPDQIDGQTSEFLDITEIVQTNTSGKISFASGDFKSNPGSTLNWTKTSHGLTPKGSGKIIVLGKLNFIANSSFNSVINLEDMEIQFYDNAEMNILQGATVNLKATILQGMACKRWKGVFLSSSKSFSYKSKIKTEYISGSYNYQSQISDANIGVYSPGSKGVIEIKPYTVFDRNDIDIKVVNASIANFAMDGAIIYSNNEAHVVVMNSNVVIGNLSGTGNWIYNGQIGIQGIESSIQLLKTEITDCSKYGAWFSANNVKNQYTFIVTSCKFTNIDRGILAENGVKSATLRKNEFNNIGRYGFEYLNNVGGQLVIGDENDVTNKNTFNACGVAAINCFQNGSSTSKIEIYNNLINNPSNTGIIIAESTIGPKNFLKFRIIGNEIGTTSRVESGIILKDVIGNNPILPNKKKRVFNADYVIRDNNIKFETSNPNTIGIQTENCVGINFINNNIQSDRLGDNWRNVGIKISEGKNILVLDNTIIAGKGLLVTGNGIFSNYYCNTFDHCVNGIQLAYNVLRNPANASTAHDDYLIHAHDFSGLVYGRPNLFTNTTSWGADMDVLTDGSLTHIKYNQWDFFVGYPYSKPRISPFPLKKPFGPKIGIGDLIKHNLNQKNPCTDNGQIAISEPVLIDLSGVSDSLLLWKLKYSVNRFNQDGLTTQFVNNTNLIKIQSIEDFIQAEDYSGAQYELNTFTPINTIDSAFKTVYSIWVSNRLIMDTTWYSYNKIYVDTIWLDTLNYSLDTSRYDTVSFGLQHRPLSDSISDILETIAELDANLINPAAFPARAILLGEKQLFIDDPEIPFYPNITGYIFSPCPESEDTGIVVKLYDESGVFTGYETTTSDSGFFAFDGKILASDSLESQYYVVAFLTGGTAHTDTATLYDLAMQSPHIVDCLEPLFKRNISTKSVQKKQILIYPNPTRSGFELTNMPSHWNLKVFDAVGKILFEQSGNGDTSIPYGILIQGMYIATITDINTNAQTSQKIFVR